MPTVVDRIGPAVEVECGDCGERFALSVRREYAHRTAGTIPRCSTCRRPERAMTEAERRRYVQWWLEESGLSAHELRELAECLGSTAATSTI